VFHIRYTCFNAKQKAIELADEFIINRTNHCDENPFKVEWVKSDITETIKKLQHGDVDIVITYSTAAEKLAIKSGIAHGCNQALACENCRKSDENFVKDKEFWGTEGNCDCCDNSHDFPCYIFRDHFYLVGPQKDLPDSINPEDEILSTSSKI